MADFTELIDLAAAKAGGKILSVTDEFFAPAANLLQPGRGVFIADKFTDDGKWMDGWESRRKRTAGYDWCLIKLGIPGVIHGFDVDTNHFRGNYPEHCSIDACAMEGDPTAEQLQDAEWTELVPISRLEGSSQNLFPIENRQRWTHLRLNIYPDGGVARFRVHGEAKPDWQQLTASGELVDLVAIQNGGVALLCNDMFFSHKNNLIMPGRAANMGEGWETKRRRGPGHDWMILRLGAPGLIRKVEIDTNHFKGNYPDSCSLETAHLPADLPADFLTSYAIDWRPLLPQTKLEAHKQHYFEQELLDTGVCTHVRLRMYPDGGISRLRLYGQPGL